MLFITCCRTRRILLQNGPSPKCQISEPTRKLVAKGKKCAVKTGTGSSFSPCFGPGVRRWHENCRKCRGRLHSLGLVGKRRQFHYCWIFGPQIEFNAESSFEGAKNARNTAWNATKCGKLSLVKVNTKFHILRPVDVKKAK